jgi:transposase-like protein
VSQHFLLSAAAGSLGLAEVARMTEEEARSRFRAVRFAENGGEPFCPHCGSLGVYEITTRRMFKCKGCSKQFSLTSGTLFNSRKMSFRDILLAIALFVNGANGVAALRLRREMKCSYKTAFVLAHKLREVMGALQTPRKLTGIVEIDGKWVGGHIKKTNLVKDRIDRRISNPKRRSIVTMRERNHGGRTLSFVFRHEADAIATILANVHPSARIRTDEAAHWNILRGYYADVKHVNHKKDGYSVRGVHTNWVEGFNSRIRRAEIGVYHRISGAHLQGYADEFSWREDWRRVSNGDQFASLVRVAVRQPRSLKWRGYWQKRDGNKLPVNDNA